jgi:V/A-type H+-transporting ATPase subunit I
MIVDAEKILLYGSKQEIERFFELAQRAGFLEFLSLSRKKGIELSSSVKDLLASCRILKKLNPHPGGKIAPPLEIARRCLELHKRHEMLLDEERILQAEIARISIFGDFSIEDLQAIEQEGKRVFQFFCMKSELASQITVADSLIFVGTDYDLDYFVSITKEKTTYPKMIEIEISHPAPVLQERLESVKQELAETEETLKKQAGLLNLVQAGLFEALSKHHLENAIAAASHPLGEHLFAVEAFIPKTKRKALQGLLSSLAVDFETVQVETTDSVPTIMENKGSARIGEDLVHIYDTPAATDKDPSSWVLFFFTLFFAMIVSDAGYGLIYLLIGLYLKRKASDAKGAVRRFLKLTLLVSSATIVWGLLTASFFGIEIGPDSPFRKASFLHTLAVKKAEYHIEQKDQVYQDYVREFPEAAKSQDGHTFLLAASKIHDGETDYVALDEFYDNLLMELALLIGTLHVCLSFARYLKRNIAGLGWILFLIGGYLFFPSILDATSLLNLLGLPKEIAYPIGKQLCFAGFGFAVLAALFQRKWAGLMEAMNVVQVFADVLSYLRLYALALAGIIMAGTMNRLSGQFSLLPGLFILIGGHGVNLVLAVMGGVIHGLRLNFLEWYHYSFEGGGRLFNPLRLIRRM